MDWHDTLISLFLYICQKYKNELYFYCKDFFFSVLRSEKGSCCMPVKGLIVKNLPILMHVIT